MWPEKPLEGLFREAAKSNSSQIILSNFSKLLNNSIRTFQIKANWRYWRRYRWCNLIDRCMFIAVAILVEYCMEWKVPYWSEKRQTEKSGRKKEKNIYSIHCDRHRRWSTKRVWTCFWGLKKSTEFKIMLLESFQIANESFRFWKFKSFSHGLSFIVLWRSFLSRSSKATAANSNNKIYRNWKRLKPERVCR